MDYITLALAKDYADQVAAGGGSGSADLKNYYKKSEIDSKLDEKVDKIEGKSLSTNDYTTEEKAKLAGLENYNDEEIKASIALKASKEDIPTKTSQLTNDSFTTRVIDGTADGSIRLASAYDDETNGLLGEYAVALGEECIASGDDSFAEGYSSKASALASHAEGKFGEASGDSSHVEGDSNIASGAKSHAEGSSTEASGENSHTEGFSTKATKACSHAEGYFNNATGSHAHAEGGYSTASGSNSHAEGYETTASSDQAHAEGFHTTASGIYSHSEGHGSEATGETSHAEGRETKASTTYAHAEGYKSEASGKAAHAEGDSCKATAQGAHAEGVSSEASGASSHAEGFSYATEMYSHAEGQWTKAQSNSQHVQGKYNISDSNNIYAHIVGNGKGVKRSNAHTVDWEGNAWFSGDVYTGSTSGTNKDDGSKRLATEDFVSSGYVPITTYSNYDNIDLLLGNQMTVSSIEGSESFTQSGKVFTAEGSGNTATQYETKIQFTNEDIIGVVFSTSFLDQYNNIGMATDCTLLISESSDYSDNNTVTITHIEDTQNSYYFFANSAKTLYLKLIYPENCKNSAAARINFLSSIKQGSTTNIEDYISGMLTSFEQESYKPTIDTLYNYYSGCALKKYYTPYEVSADSSLSISLGKNMKYDIQMNSGSSISIDNLDSNLSNSITDINTTMLIRTAHTDSTYTFSNNINTTLCLSGDDTNNNTISLQKGKIYKIDFDICGTYIIGKVTSFNYQLPPS